MIRDILSDNDGIARALVSLGGEEYPVCIDLEEKRSWCTCPYWVYNKTPCKHILELMNYIERDKMVNKRKTLDYLGTDCELLDELLGGGVPYGTVTTVFGQPMSGKSMFIYQVGLANIKESGKKTLYVDTEGLRPIDMYKVVYKFNQRFGVDGETIKKDFEFYPAVGDYQLQPIQKIFQIFGMMPTFAKSKGGRYTVTFDKCTPKIKEEDLSKYSMIIIDSLTAPLKTSVGSTTSNLPARAQLTERLFGLLHSVAIRHNISIILSHHASVDPMVLFGRDLGKPWGGDPILYNSKYAIEFIDSTSKIRTDTGWGVEARRAKLIRRPDDVADGELHPIRLKKDWGYTTKNDDELR